jgi:hypothetical protein
MAAQLRLEALTRLRNGESPASVEADLQRLIDAACAPAARAREASGVPASHHTSGD